MTIIEIPPPSEIVGQPIRKLMGCISSDPVRVGYFFVKSRGRLLTYHDLYHLEVACLERIQIGKANVSGIHGINSPELHDSPILEEYDGLLDEARVALHEWLTRPSIFNTIKLFLWLVWLTTQGINPFFVLIRHIKSIKRRQPNKLELADISFVYENSQPRTCQKSG